MPLPLLPLHLLQALPQPLLHGPVGLQLGYGVPQNPAQQGPRVLLGLGAMPGALQPPAGRVVVAGGGHGGCGGGGGEAEGFLW